MGCARLTRDVTTAIAYRAMDVRRAAPSRSDSLALAVSTPRSPRARHARRSTDRRAATHVQLMVTAPRARVRHLPSRATRALPRARRWVSTRMATRRARIAIRSARRASVRRPHSASAATQRVRYHSWWPTHVHRAARRAIWSRPSAAATSARHASRRV
jgi:hypothetical protein